MIYVFEGLENTASIVFNGNSLTETQKQKAIVLEELPAKENNGMNALLKADKLNNLVWWEYVPTIPKTILTKAEFFGRMTFTEQNSLVNYDIMIIQSETDEAIKTQKIMAMRTLWNLLNNLSDIDLNYNEILQPFAQIVSWCGLIATERIIQI